jgi:hypothetical protein
MGQIRKPWDKTERLTRAEHVLPDPPASPMPLRAPSLCSLRRPAETLTLNGLLYKHFR